MYLKKKKRKHRLHPKHLWWIQPSWMHREMVGFLKFRSCQLLNDWAPKAAGSSLRTKEPVPTHTILSILRVCLWNVFIFRHSSWKPPLTTERFALKNAVRSEFLGSIFLRSTGLSCYDFLSDVRQLQRYQVITRGNSRSLVVAQFILNHGVSWAFWSWIPVWRKEC